MKKTANKKKKAFLHDNGGVALISVMVVAMVCMLVATVVLQLTYTALLSRKVNKASNSNFYSAESAVDSMETVLQSIAVYSTERLKLDTSKEFIDVAADVLYTSAGTSASADPAAANAAISEYIFRNIDESYQKILCKKDSDGVPIMTEGRYTYDGSKFWVSAIQKKEGDGSTTKGTLTVTINMNYENEKGYLTNISTDLVMNDVTHRTPASAYSLGSYSMFTGGGATFKGNDVGNTNGGHYYLNVFVQEGNAYIGAMRDEAPKALDIYQTGVIFDGNRVIINGDVYLRDHASLIFAGSSVTDASGNTKKTEVDVRGTIYIDSSSVLVVGDGVDLMTKDIKLDNGSEQWSVFEAGKDSYIKCPDGVTTTFPTKIYPYMETLEQMKAGLPTSHVFDEHGASSNTLGGCILFSTGGNCSVVEYNGGKWYKKGTTAVVDATINHESTFIPQALATFWAYDGTKQSVDAELIKFVNCPVLYWQKNFGDGAAFNMRQPVYLGSGTPAITKGTLRYEADTPDYTFGKTSFISGINSDYIYDNWTSLGGGSYTAATSFNFLDTDMNRCNFILGNVSEVVHANKTEVLWANQWQDANVQVPSDSYVGTVISASKGVYSIQGSGASVGYSVLLGNAEGSGDGLDKLVNQYKYVGFIQTSILNKSGNGSRYVLTTEWNNFYSLGLLDSLYVGGLESFKNSDDSDDVGGDVTINVTNMYDFISQENWQSN